MLHTGLGSRLLNLFRFSVTTWNSSPPSVVFLVALNIDSDALRDPPHSLQEVLPALFLRG